MANVKLSQIASGGNLAGATDVVVTVRSGTTDLLCTPVTLDLAQTWVALQTFTNSDLALLGSSTGYTIFTSANSSATNYTATIPANTGTIAELNLAQTWTAVQTFTNSDIRLLGSSTGYTTLTSANAGASNFTLTLPAVTGQLSVAATPIAVGASATAVGGGKYLLNTAAGSVLTLPAATGSGLSIDAIVTVSTTSNAHKVLAATTSDFIIGVAFGQHSGTVAGFQSPLATNHSIQMPFSGSQPSGGIVGDKFTFIDVAANLWECTGSFSAGTTATTPFSSADT